MQNAPRLALFALLAPLAMAGCDSTRSGYPSLAPRPIERLSLAEPDRPAPAPETMAAEDTESAARLAPLVAQAREADTAFRDALRDARPALNRGRNAPTGSDAWVNAQEALSRVVIMREPVSKALAELDAERDRGSTETNSQSAAATLDAFEAVRAIDQSEREALKDAWPNPQ